MAEIPEEQIEDNLGNKIQIFSNTDEKLKFLGKILNNDSSREILQLLIEKEMTANEIATQTKLSIPLVLYHINQMIESGIAVVSKTSTNGKHQPMKHYSAKSGIIILPEKAVDKANNSKLFFRSLKNIMKFASIGVVGFLTWFYDLSSVIETNNMNYPVPFGKNVDEISSLEISLIVIIIGLIIERVFSYKKNKKKGV